jgi:hypothetical protein
MNHEVQFNLISPDRNSARRGGKAVEPSSAIVSDYGRLSGANDSVDKLNRLRSVVDNGVDVERTGFPQRQK